ncbi:hypothetical protein DFJ58DRAFT_475598 [Suillus subalutaceus]|uniref:uncharacterized protein n=1 Tax=Suillus subalutaceus TaxID=48586 RepID=UPI001B8733C9|nr:uncharacterized protein DFJ58DRAFT_475598 [Suillus subalutaceus]KAG1848090.1 hypothetical protein DFJ58DRAFT_475598 [Suillus subalutaceus]
MHHYWDERPDQNTAKDCNTPTFLLSLSSSPSSPLMLCSGTTMYWLERTPRSAHHTPFDISSATLLIITTHVAYVACIVLGGVLLQTAPAASLGCGGCIGTKGVGICAKGTNTLKSKMESFWRVVRETERHEHVTSLPAPHVWQVCPPGQSSELRSAPVCLLVGVPVRTTICSLTF